MACVNGHRQKIECGSDELCNMSNEGAYCALADAGGDLDQDVIDLMQGKQAPDLKSDALDKLNEFIEPLEKKAEEEADKEKAEGEKEEAKEEEKKEEAKPADDGVQCVTMMFEDPEVTGGVDKRFVVKAVSQHTKEMRSCYERELARNEDLQEKVVISWTITGAGTVKDPVMKSPADNERLKTCMTNALKWWKFPQPKDHKSETQVEFPFVFKYEGGGCLKFTNLKIE